MQLGIRNETPACIDGSGRARGFCNISFPDKFRLLPPHCHYRADVGGNRLLMESSRWVYRPDFFRTRHLFRSRGLFGGHLHDKARNLRLVGDALGGPMAMLSGLLLGWICFRLRGSYFNLATLAIGEVFRQVAIFWRDLTDGMQGILIITTFRSKVVYYFLALGLAALCMFTISRIMKSKWGFYFMAIREDQDSAEAMGISSFRYKSLSLMVSSFFTGLAGAFYMNYMGFIDPEVVFSLYFISIMAILVAIIGGAGTIWGPAVGAFIMVLLHELFRSSFFGYAPKSGQQHSRPGVRIARYPGYQVHG